MLNAIYYYKDERSRNPVKEFIDKLPLKGQAKIFAYITELRTHGHDLHRPVSGYLRDGIHELRPKNNRIFYFYFMRDNAVLVHAIKKKTDRLSREDLDIAIRRKLMIERDKGEHYEKM